MRYLRVILAFVVASQLVQFTPVAAEPDRERRDVHISFEDSESPLIQPFQGIEGIYSHVGLLDATGVVERMIFQGTTPFAADGVNGLGPGSTEFCCDSFQFDFDPLAEISSVSLAVSPGFGIRNSDVVLTVEAIAQDGSRTEGDTVVFPASDDPEIYGFDWRRIEVAIDSPIDDVVVRSTGSTRWSIDSLRYSGLVAERPVVDSEPRFELAGDAATGTVEVEVVRLVNPDPLVPPRYGYADSAIETYGGFVFDEQPLVSVRQETTYADGRTDDRLLCTGVGCERDEQTGAWPISQSARDGEIVLPARYFFLAGGPPLGSSTIKLTATNLAGNTAATTFEVITSEVGSVELPFGAPRAVEVSQGVNESVGRVNEPIFFGGEGVTPELQGRSFGRLVPGKPTLFRFYVEGNQGVDYNGNSALIVEVRTRDGRTEEHRVRPNVNTATVNGSGTVTETVTNGTAFAGSQAFGQWNDGEASGLIRSARNDLTTTVNYVLPPEALPDDAESIRFALGSLSILDGETGVHHFTIQRPVRIGWNAVYVDTQRYGPNTRPTLAELESAIGPYFEAALPISSFEIPSYGSTTFRSAQLDDFWDAIETGEPSESIGDFESMCTDAIWDYYLDGGYDGGVDDFTSDPSILPTALVLNVPVGMITGGAAGCAPVAGARASTWGDLDLLVDAGRNELGNLKNEDLVVGLVAPNLLVSALRGDTAVHETLHAAGFLHATSDPTSPLGCTTADRPTNSFTDGRGGVTQDSLGYIFGRQPDDRWSVYLLDDVNTAEIMSYCRGIGQLQTVMRTYLDAGLTIQDNQSFPSAGTYSAAYGAIVGATEEREDCPAAAPSCDVDLFLRTCTAPTIEGAIPGVSVDEWALSHLGIPVGIEGGPCPVLAAFIGFEFTEDLLQELFGEDAGTVAAALLTGGLSLIFENDVHASPFPSDIEEGVTFSGLMLEDPGWPATSVLNLEYLNAEGVAIWRSPVVFSGEPTEDGAYLEVVGTAPGWLANEVVDVRIVPDIDLTSGQTIPLVTMSAGTTLAELSVAVAREGEDLTWTVAPSTADLVVRVYEMDVSDGSFTLLETVEGQESGMATVAGTMLVVATDGVRTAWATSHPLAPSGRECTIIGTEGNDRLIGTNGDDVICGLGGDDIIFGRDGADTISGGSGNDRIIGGPGADVLYGGPGIDSLRGNTGNDTVEGGADADELVGDGGADVLQGGPGDDEILGGDQDDVMSGGSGSDLLIGGEGRDSLAGDGGNDVLRGGPAADSHSGGPGFDRCDGGGGGVRDTADESCEIVDNIQG